MSKLRGVVLSSVIACALGACGVKGATFPPGGGGVHFDGGACSVGQVQCAGKCVYISSDPANCGACGSACAAGDTCQASKCVSPGGNPGVCPPGQTNCNGTCTDTSVDIFNCGACGTACAADESCLAGQCNNGQGCVPGQTNCSGACSDLNSDPNNCGACGTACGPGSTCQSGQCSSGGGGGGSGTANCGDTVTCLNGCAATDQTCQTNCFNSATPQAQMLLNTALQCLDMACPSKGGGVCDQSAANYNSMACDQCFQGAQTGQCGSQVNACLNDTGGGGGGGGCPGGQTDCGGGQCVDVSSDANNCGACFNACNFGETCQAGQCSGGGGGGGGTTGCSGTLGCLNTCAAGDTACEQQCIAGATAQGQQLLDALSQCVEQDCPSSPGGVCDPNGGTRRACNRCYNTSQAPGGNCYSALNDCLNDLP
jgi:hypothetical protein